MTTTLNRADLLAAIPGITPKAMRALEEYPVRIATAQDSADSAQGAADQAVEATNGIMAATVLTLSANDSFDNERVLAVDSTLDKVDTGPGGTLTLKVKNPITRTPAYTLAFTLTANTTLTLPPSGKVATTIPPGPYADDATAATNGVGVGEMYAKTGGVVSWRQA